jgi:hypothetical protein
MGKNPVKSKSIWAGILMVVVGAISGIAGTDVIQSNPELAGYCVSILGVLTIVLRLMTKEPIK